MRYLFAAALCVAISTFSLATAQDIDQYLTSSPATAWIEPIARPTRDFDLGGQLEVNYLLVDRQFKYTDTETDRYFHYADQLLTPNAVEGNSTVTVNFDPAYQTVVFHRLHRIRAGQETDILDLSRFDLYRVETDREKLIYNGTLQLSFLIPDVRVGDILDYSYTIKGKNPAIGRHFAGGFQHRFSVAVQHQFERALFPEETDIHVKSFGENESPQISKTGDHTEYTWDRWDVPALTVDSNTPPSFIAFPTTMFSTFDSWQSVGAYFAPFYDVTDVSSGKIREIAADIRSENQTPQTRLRAALDFVQREVRYLGVELGQGGYIPRQPDQVLSNRFGDCKDMTLLLIAILAELEIDAVPLLVSQETAEGVDVFIPSYGVFDHIIVSASLGGKTYYLDPTRGEQLGDLDNLQQGNFGKGVIVATDGPGMIDTPVPVPEFWKDITDIYDVVSEPGTIFLTSASTYRMGHADGMLAWYNREGAAAAEKSFLEYFQNAYPQIEQLAPMQLDVDEIGGEISITAKYRIPDAWQDGDTADIQLFYAQADDVLQDLPEFVGAARTMPFKLQHPVRTRQTLQFLLDDTWMIENDQKLINRPSFTFRMIDRFIGYIYTKQIVYQTKSSEISGANFRDTMAAIRDARQQVGVSLSIDNAVQSNTLQTWLSGIEDLESKVVLWQVVTTLLSFAVAIYLVKHDKTNFSEQIFYPVSMTKFVILTGISFGVYPIFWSFMNWRWVKEMEPANISPGMRAFFMNLTNFSLFDRMASNPHGFRWLRWGSAPLALIILIGAVVDHYYSRTPDAPDSLFLFGLGSMIAWLPVVAHVNMLNKDRPESIQENSRFGWPALGFLVLFFPIFGLILYGFLWAD